MLAPNSGFPTWIWAQGLLTAVLAALLCVAFYMWTDIRYTKDYNWRTSRAFKSIVVSVPLAVALAVWYRVESNDLWIARSDAIAGVEYFVGTPGSPEIIDVEVDDWPAWWLSDRPRQVSNPCQTHPFRGSAEIFAVEAADAVAFLEEVENSLKVDGWETEFRTGDLGGPFGSIRAFRGEQSLLIEGPNLNSEPDLDSFTVISNLLCDETDLGR